MDANELFPTIRARDSITIITPQGHRRTGRAVMKSSSDGWVLNMGGRYGTPGLANINNTVKIRKTEVYPVKN